ncbi:hypothetical protein LOZ22_006027 [Ophidiomyces ophidiicola]|nr:hypothetical protein LOZ22_006027 [Ophidiomyces ophidiicola]
MASILSSPGIGADHPPLSPQEVGTSTGIETNQYPPPAMANNNSSDEEEGRPPRYTRENDPFELSSKLKTDAEINSIPANTSRRRKLARLHGTRSSAKKLQGFYRTQNENIERLLKPVDEHIRLARELNTQNQLRYKIAVYGSFAANVVLAILQLYGAIASGSLSLFTTMADSVFDPLSNLTLLLCHKTVQRVDARKFPAGKARIETAGNICFCFLMTAVSFILIAFSTKDLASGSENETLGFHLPSVIAVSIAFVTKLVLFLYCWAIRNQYSQVRILWEDHRNDLAINGFGILTTAYSEFQLIIGITADTKMQQLITYICKYPTSTHLYDTTLMAGAMEAMTHSPLINAIDTVRAYTSGPRLVVEVDIVMDPDSSLRATHDVAEELQMKLESLPDVERAYVHVDFETTHKPEHFLKKDL